MSQPISISLTDLTNHPETLREEIESGLGSKDGALGIIVIKGDYPVEGTWVIELTTDDRSPSRVPSSPSKAVQTGLYPSEST